MSEKKFDPKIWTKENAAKVRVNRRRWRSKNPEKVKQLRRRWWWKYHSTENLSERISVLVPANISASVRDDICQQIAVEVLSGLIRLCDIPANIERIRKEQSKFLPSSYQYRLDALEPWQRERLEQRVVTR